jgi:nanoRNase/pAp phosphatase (c-di-AMP/oligoRNAs hydrolase)
MDVSTVASKFGGGGHKNAAGFNFTGDIQENISRILEFTRNYIEK